MLVSFDQDLGDWNIIVVTDMTDMFDNVELSIANYDSILIKWEAQDVQSNVDFSAGYSNIVKAGMRVKIL